MVSPNHDFAELLAREKKPNWNGHFRSLGTGAVIRLTTGQPRVTARPDHVVGGSDGSRQEALSGPDVYHKVIGELNQQTRTLGIESLIGWAE